MKSEKVIVKTLSSQAKDYLFNLIIEGHFKPGDEIPSEMQLIETLGVSKGVVREAFRSLAALGILDTASGKRPRIKPFDPAPLAMIVSYLKATDQASCEQMFQMRALLEISCAGIAALEASREDFDHIFQALERIEGDHSQGSDPQTRLENDIAFHNQIAKASGNPLYATMIPALASACSHAIAQRWHAFEDHEITHVTSHHREVADHIRRRNVEGASYAMSAHFDATMKALRRSESLMPSQ